MPVSHIIGMLSVHRLKWLKNMWHCVKCEKTVCHHHLRKTQIYWESPQYCSFRLVLLKGCIKSVYGCSSCCRCNDCLFAGMLNLVDGGTLSTCDLCCESVYCVPTIDMCHVYSVFCLPVHDLLLSCVSVPLYTDFSTN